MADAGRVIAGSARGIRLVAPGAGTRPLTDRVKQTLFAILEPELSDAWVLDLFAGSGAGAIEALSRGAAAAILVESERRAGDAIRRNLATTGLTDRARLVRADVASVLRLPNDRPFDVVLLDPPYDRPELLERALEALAGTTGAADVWLAESATVVAKHFWRTPPPPVVGLLASVRERRFGETALTFYRRRASSDGADPAGEDA